MFGFAQRGAHFVLGVDDKSHRSDHVNLFHPRVVILVCQPNSVNDLSIPKSPCIAQSMFPIFFQGGIAVSDIMCGDGISHIDRCPPNFIVQCSTW